MKKKELVLGLVLGFILFASLLGNLGFASAQIHGTDTSTFSYTIEGWSCQKDAVSSSWKNLTTRNLLGVVSNGVMVSGGNCTLYASSPSGTCCPTDIPNCWSDGVCRVGGEFCSNYNTSQSCSSANSAGSLAPQNSVVNGSIMCTREGVSDTYDLIGLNFGLLNPTCFNYTDCSCKWNGTDCNGNAQPRRHCENDSDTNDSEYDTDGCVYSVPSSTNSLGCDASGVIVYTSTATWKGPASAKSSLSYINCVNKVRTYTCPDTAKLPFFGIFNLFISVIIIGVVYFFVRK